jgi:hypothetical protein
MTRRLFLALPFGIAFAADAPAALLSGFHLMYHLKFKEAREVFLAWQRDHPEDPMGFAAEAAAHLFEEFEQHGVLTTEFFLDDDLLLGGIKGTADATRTAAFERANARARSVSENVLKRGPRDVNALLALTLSTGMQADYLSIIAKRQLDSLIKVRAAETYGKRLLAVAPGMGDGYMALGAASYILGCLPFYKRTLLWFGGIQGDKQRGLDELAQAARTGTYLAPYAKIMLALALLREKRLSDSLTLMKELTNAFPESPLFAREQAKIERTATK